MTASELHTRAILVSLRLSAWAARKYDRKVSQETAAAHNTTIDAGRYNKHLLPVDAPSYKALMAHIASMRTWHYEQTLAWSDDGWRLLPIKNYNSYSDGMRDRMHALESLTAEFIRDYPSLREQARQLLNGMYQESDYPRDITSKFSRALEFSPVPSGSDYRVTLSTEEVTAIAQSTESRIKSALADAQQDGVKRLYDCVRRMHERLAQPDAIFRDSLIQNARDLCDVLARLNLTDDPALESLRRETETLAQTEPQTLRDVPDVRADTAARAQSILDAMTATYGASSLA